MHKTKKILKTETPQQEPTVRKSPFVVGKCSKELRILLHISCCREGILARLRADSHTSTCSALLLPAGEAPEPPSTPGTARPTPGTDRGGVARSKHRPSPYKRICAQAHDVLSTSFFFSKQGQGREKAIVYKRHIILLSIFFTVIGTEPAALLHQELEKFKRWSKERAKQALERREAHLHSITKNHFISKPCPLCSGRRTLRFSHL